MELNRKIKENSDLRNKPCPREPIAETQHCLKVLVERTRQHYHFGLWVGAILPHLKLLWQKPDSIMKIGRTFQTFRIMIKLNSTKFEYSYASLADLLIRLGSALAAVSSSAIESCFQDGRGMRPKHDRVRILFIMKSDSHIPMSGSPRKTPETRNARYQVIREEGRIVLRDRAGLELMGLVMYKPVQPVFP